MTSATEPVTIVMPLYNGERYVRDAIDSVIAQTTGEWRLLVVDDASTDDSVGIVHTYGDPRITVVRNDRNLGLYGTLAATLPRVNTDWIAILMQDDRLRPEYLAQMAGLREAYPDVDGFWCQEHLIDQYGREIAVRTETSRVERIEPGVPAWRNVLRQGCIWTISGSLTHRRLFAEVPFRSDLPHSSDFDWFLRAVRTHPFVYCERALIEVRHHAGQASSRNMRTGRDLAELLRVVACNVEAHATDVPRALVWRIGLYRAGQAARRTAANLIKGRLAPARSLAAIAGQFLGLPAGFTLRRL